MLEEVAATTEAKILNCRQGSAKTLLHLNLGGEENSLGARDISFRKAPGLWKGDQSVFCIIHAMFFFLGGTPECKRGGVGWGGRGVSDKPPLR
jgi:hypothetical protein